MTIVTDTRTAPAAWAVEAVRSEDAARQEAYFSAAKKNGFNLHGWSHPERPAPMTEDEIMAAAAERQAAREAFLASPKGRIHAACKELLAVGSDDVAQSIMAALSRSGLGNTITPRSCGVILKILDGMNTSTARAVVQAVADNLRAL